MSDDRFPSMLAVLLLAMVGAGCSAAADERIKEEREIESFQIVKTSISGRIELRQSDEVGLEIEAEADTLARIVTEVTDGVLRIYEENGAGWWRRSGPIRIRIHYTTLAGLDMSGSADVETDEIRGTDFEVTIAGSSNIDIPALSVETLNVRVSGSGDLEVDELVADAVELQVSGSGDLELAGKTEALTVSVSGSGNVEGEQLSAQEAEVTVRGSGDVEVRAVEALEVRISGSGNVDYWGDPDLTSRISGSGDLNRR